MKIRIKKKSKPVRKIKLKTKTKTTPTKKLKIKFKKVSKVPYPLITKDRLTEIITNVHSRYGLYNAFNERLRSMKEGSASYYKYIQHIYEELFNESIPHEHSWHRIRTKINYYLSWLGHEHCGVSLPPVSQKNMDAAWKFDINSMNESMSTMISILENCTEQKGGIADDVKTRYISQKEKRRFKIKEKVITNSKKGEGKMAKKIKFKKKSSEEPVVEVPTKLTKGKKKVTKKVTKPVTKKAVQKEAKKLAKKLTSKKEKKVTVTETYIALLKKNVKAKLSDAKLAAEMRTAFPDKKKYTEKDVKAVRSLYNKGKLTGQEGVAPKTPSKEY